ncbi:envoplakin-like [Triplophysa rosa]|uniref:Envoplakin-like protein n=1 Tax=Triplophysa rosa TaxID=992332 RepID=A0A9W7WL33_TRIRA|nr:envoplakin-like [Triplophysa rosa]KAI7803536.1 putative envoplakin-like protein [Triplophysa rosa]
MNGQKKHPVKSSRSEDEDLTSLVNQLQLNADQFEKCIQQIQKLQIEDTENESNGSPLKHNSEVKEILSQVENLLSPLFLDVDKVKKRKYPLARLVEDDVNQLYDRFRKQHGIYRNLYNQLKPACPTPAVDLSKGLSDNQIQVEKNPVREMSLPEQLLQTLDNLDSDNLKRFRWYLKQERSVSASHLENADSVDIVDKMVECFGAKGAFNTTLNILRKLKQNNLADQLENNLKEVN